MRSFSNKKPVLNPTRKFIFPDMNLNDNKDFNNNKMRLIIVDIKEMFRLSIILNLNSLQQIE